RLRRRQVRPARGRPVHGPRTRTAEHPCGPSGHRFRCRHRLRARPDRRRARAGGRGQDRARAADGADLHRRGLLDAAPAIARPLDPWTRPAPLCGDLVMANVAFYFDFGSPNAYLSHKVIPGIEARTGVRFEYVPVLLGGLFKLTGNRSPAEAFAGIKNKLAYEGLETQRFVRRNGLTVYRSNPFFPVNTLKIMRGAVAAQGQGVFDAYVEAVFHHMWEAPKKMDDPEV